MIKGIGPRGLHESYLDYFGRTRPSENAQELLVDEPANISALVSGTSTLQV